MKNRFVQWMLVLCLLLGMATVGAQAAQPDSLKVLAIGNSYSMDSLNYLPQIAEAFGKKVELGCLMLPSGALADHAANSLPGPDGQQPGAYRWYTYVDGTWNRVNEKNLQHGLTARDWDVIILQQRSQTSGVASSYGADLTAVGDYVNANKTNPNAKLLWHMTWAYDSSYQSSGFTSAYGKDQTRMYQSIVSAVNSRIMPLVGAGKTFETVIPTGTAIQNGRIAAPTTAFNRDGTHLSTLGRMIASYTWYAKLFGVEKLDKLPVVFVPASYDGNTGSYRLAASEEIMVLDAVNNALARPLAVTGGTTTGGSGQTNGNTGSSGSGQTGGSTGHSGACPAQAMSDVPADAWFHNAVDWVLSKGVMNGLGEGKFAPYTTLSRAQMVQVLYNKEGQPTLGGLTHSFTDVPADQWYNNAVTWAAAHGIVSGYGNGLFKPDDRVTLEQVFVILWNYEGNPPLTGDADAVGPHSEWAGNAIGWAQARGLLDDLTFTKVINNANRAQTAQIMMNLLGR